MRFVMKFYDEGDDAVDLDVTKDRMEKYRLRGFDIRPHPESEKIKNHIIQIMNKNGIVDGVDAVEKGLLNLDLFYLE